MVWAMFKCCRPHSLLRTLRVAACACHTVKGMRDEVSTLALRGAPGRGLLWQVLVLVVMSMSVLTLVLVLEMVLVPVLRVATCDCRLRRWCRRRRRRCREVREAMAYGGCTTRRRARGTAAADSELTCRQSFSGRPPRARLVAYRTLPTPRP